MNGEHRNRAEGWKYAKLSGHENEKIVCDLIKKDASIQNRILRCAHKEGRVFVDATYGGLNEKLVSSVLGGQTKSKTDICVLLDDESTINISLKKERGGQVYLINPERFIDGFEKQYSKTIPEEVKKGIGLFWGFDEGVIDIIARYSTKHKDYEMKKHRVVAETLREFDIELSEALVGWFADNIADLFTFCFSRGLASDKKEWADLIWYRNELSEDGEDIDTLLNISDMCGKLSNKSEYGNKTGGSTIQLPFGMVQWHSPTKKIPGDMQFHHSYDKIMESIKDLEKDN